MVEVQNVIKFLINYIMCFIYSAWVSFGILIAFIFKRDTKFWVVKDRPIAPRSLTNKEYGEHKFMNVNGIKIHYVEKGDPSKPLMLFVHGYPEFWFSWRYQLKEFSKDYYVIAINQRGYADSDKPSKVSDYRIDKMVDDIRGMVKQLDRKKFILVCHDWGAVVGFRYVLRYMDTLEKYVMIGGPPVEVWRELIFSSFEQFFMSWYVFLFQMPYLPEFLATLSDFKVFKVMEHKSEEDLEAYKYVFSKKGALTGPINYYRAATNWLFPEPPLKRPSTFVPGLFLLGEAEKYISRSSGKMAKKLYDNLEFKLIPGGNHFAQQHAPEATNKLIREFIEKK